MRNNSPLKRQTERTDALQSSAAESFDPAGISTPHGAVPGGNSAGRVSPRARPAFSLRCGGPVGRQRFTSKGGHHDLTGRRSEFSLGVCRKLDSEYGRVRAVTGAANSICTVALWSSVTMSQPAKAYRLSTWEVLHLPAEELRRLEIEGRKPKPIVPTIDLSTITADSQLALISISGHPICSPNASTSKGTSSTSG